MAAPVIDRTRLNSLFNDGGFNLDGSPWTKAEIAATIMDPIDALAAAIIPAGSSVALSGANHNFAIASAGRSTIVRLSPTALSEITGILATGMTGGTRVTCWNNAAFPIEFFHQHASSSAGNKLYMPNARSIVIHERQCVVFEYDTNGGTWIFVSSSQVGPRCRAYRASTNQSIATGAETLCVLNAEAYDYYSEFDTATGLWTAREAGIYRATGAAYLSAPTGRVMSIIFVAGAPAQYSMGYTVASDVALQATFEGPVAAAGTIGLYARHDSAGAIDLVLGEKFTSLAISRIW